MTTETHKTDSPLIEINLKLSPRLPALLSRFFGRFVRLTIEPPTTDVDPPDVQPAKAEPVVAPQKTIRPKPAPRDRIFQVIDGSRLLGMSKSHLARAVRSISATERDAAIESLLAAEEICSEVVRVPGSRSHVRYFAL
jgi:hypothetical protein